jgi:hypothetical protein
LWYSGIREVEGRLTLDLFTREWRGRSSQVKRIRERLPIPTPKNKKWAAVLGGCEDDIDTTLTPLGTQYGATHCNPEQKNSLRYAAFATSGKPKQRLMDHS